MTPGTDMVITGSSLTLTGGITAPGNLTLDGSSVTVAGAVNVAGILTLKNSSILSHYGATTSATYKLDITAASVSVDATSKIDVSGKGYLGGRQGGNNTDTGMTLGNVTTGGSTYYANGGSYGGLGGLSGSGSVNTSYGSLMLPGELGSGGSANGSSYPGASGGGLVKLTAGALTLNGGILADGGIITNSNGGGAGSGGGVLVNVGTLSGTGTISACGGAFTYNTNYGSGGGGRIAIYYDTNTLPAGNIVAPGGQSGNGTVAARNGGAGTVYIQQNVMSLIVSKDGTGAGTVSSAPSGISCGSTCSSQFVKNGTVILTATPDVGSAFTSWSGACSGNGSCTLTMDVAKTVTASFALIPTPTVSISSPVGTIKNNRPLLQYSVSAGTAVVKVDGNIVSKLSGNTLDILSDGSHTVRVEATNAGVTGFAVSTFTVDTIAPTVTVTGLPSIVKTTPQTLSGTMETGSSVTVSVTTGTASIGTVTYPTSTTWQCVVSNLTVGANSFTITAHDQAGNSSQTIASVTYELPVTLGLSVPTITASSKDSVVMTISNIDPAGSEVLVEQFVNANNNGVIDAGDYAIRAFKVTDGVMALYPNIPGDEDAAGNKTIVTTLSFALTSDITHAPGSYLFRVTSGSDTATALFTVTPVAQPQTVAGTVTDSSNPVPGAMIRLLDKWQQPVAWSIADNSGNYSLYVPVSGEYRIIPIAYGFVSDPAGSQVTLSSGQTITSHSLTLTPGTIHLTGKVQKDQTTDPVGGVWVQAVGGNGIGYAITAADGSYDLKLTAGQYDISVAADTTLPNPSAKGYLGATKQPQNINLQTDTTNFNIPLTPVSITVTGKVVDQYGTPQSGLPVLGKLAAAANARELVSFATTDSNGNYTLNLSPGTQWTISLDDSVAQNLGYLGSRISNFSTASTLTGNNLIAQQTVSWIKGTVRDSSANVLGNIDIQLRSSDSTVVTHLKTAADGTYALAVYGGNWYVNAFFDYNGPQSVGEQTATVTSGQTTTIDFVVDVAQPSVVITSPTASTTPDNTPLLTYTVNEGTVVVKVDGALVNKVSGNSLDVLGNGSHAVVVEATDSSGNISSASVAFTVNYTPLALSSTAPADGAIGIAYNKAYTVFDLCAINATTIQRILLGTEYRKIVSIS